MKRTTGSRVRHFLWAAAVCIPGPLITAHAQESSEQQPVDEQPIEEIIVSVDRQGKPVDVNAVRLEEVWLEIAREFEILHTKEEEEEFRLKLRSSMQRKTSRIAWGYDAQAEAARIPVLQSLLLPIDRVRPATVVSFRF